MSLNNTRLCHYLIIIGSSLISTAVLGAQGDLAFVAKNFTANLIWVAKLIIAISYVSGIGFGLSGLLKLKAHKDQPAQVPLSQPLVLLVISAGLLFLPSMINTAGKTLWGDQAKLSSPDGESIATINLD